MVLTLKPIKAKVSPLGTDNVQQLIAARIGVTGFIGGMVRRMSDYPPAKPWRHPPPKTGPRRGGRRTGGYGRNWGAHIRVRVTSDTVDGQASNQVGYGIYVGGPRIGQKGKRQAWFMRDRGWPNITSETTREWLRTEPEIRRILRQQDSRIRRRRYRT